MTRHDPVSPEQKQGYTVRPEVLKSEFTHPTCNSHKVLFFMTLAKGRKWHGGFTTRIRNTGWVKIHKNTGWVKDSC